MSTKHGIDDDHVGLWLLLRRTAAELNTQLSTAIADALHDDNLSALSYAVLDRVNQHPARTFRTSQLATDLGLATSSATRLIDRLTDAKLLDRQLSPTDRRVVFLVITPAGQALVAQLQPVAAAEADRWYQQLGGPHAARQLKHLSHCLIASDSSTRQAHAPAEPDRAPKPAIGPSAPAVQPPSPTLSRYPLVLDSVPPSDDATRPEG